VAYVAQTRAKPHQLGVCEPCHIRNSLGISWQNVA